MPLKDKIALITGSSRGIGKSIALRFAQAGATVIITGRNEQTVKQCTKEITDAGFSAEGLVLDVTSLENVKENANKILDKHKRIDILINNAGITKDNLLIRLSEEDWSDVIKINLNGVFNCTKVVAKSMLKAKSGRIINISSIIGIKGNTGQANYSASKAGIIGLTKSTALEFASRGITANAVAPGYIQTDMTSDLSDKAREAILNKIPMGTLGEPEDIAGACLFLASDDAKYITGQTLIIDGGMAIH